MKIYLICQDWSNTSNNHAGIKYMCNKLQENYPKEIRTFVFPALFDNQILSKNKVIARLQTKYIKYQLSKYSQIVERDLLGLLKDGDIVFVMEYLEKLTPMKEFVDRIKNKRPQTTIWAMAHLTPIVLDSTIPSNHILIDWLRNVSKIFTLGNSLSEYLEGRGINYSKIATTFHYVDDYYFIKKERKQSTRLKVLAMGNQMRNLSLLSKLVEENPETDFTICQGVLDMSTYFKDKKNVRLIPFVPEPDLRKYMEDSDVSLNVMNDTVGSNVIVTSLAMGLAMICSNVGSICDYCDESNTIFCNNDNPDSFSHAINKLSKDKNLLIKMQQSAINKAKSFTLERFYKDIKKHLS